MSPLESKEMNRLLAIAEEILKLAAEAAVTLEGGPEVEGKPVWRIAEATDKIAAIGIKAREALR